VSPPLAGVKVVELGMWAFVPSCAALLSDLGAKVIKIEAPSGDPIRALTSGGLAPGDYGFTLSWELYNRGKRSIALDLNVEGALEVLHKLLDDADVFVTSFLPPARRRLKIDLKDIRDRHPSIIYAVGSGQGARGPEAEQGGFDAISFWARAGIADAVTPESAAYPLGMPSGAFGDTLSGAMLAAGIVAAIAKQARTGQTSVVDASLLGTGMWCMQRNIAAAALIGVDRFAQSMRGRMPNPLVNTYRTADRRYVALNMLQGQRYWAGFCAAAGRPELAEDARFATAEDRVANLQDCVAELDAMFAKKTLAEWRAILSSQDGAWGVFQTVGDLQRDPQVDSNQLMQEVDYADGRKLKMISAPMQFDGGPLPLAPAPELGADTDAILAELGYGPEAIIDMKVAGILY
jgi:crotonobetainyl-CoA:carnitine CoA-transferase CaiB-like acyl-CoA transferase